MSGRRHLSISEAEAALRRGAEVQQFLGRLPIADGRQGVRWLTAHAHGSRFALRLQEVEDVGTQDFLDVAEFPPLDPDEYVGEGRSVAERADPAAVLAAAVDLGAADDRWVNPGILQDEYAESRGAP